MSDICAQKPPEQQESKWMDVLSHSGGVIQHLSARTLRRRRLLCRTASNWESFQKQLLFFWNVCGNGYLSRRLALPFLMSRSTIDPDQFPERARRAHTAGFLLFILTFGCWTWLAHNEPKHCLLCHRAPVAGVTHLRLQFPLTGLLCISHQPLVLSLYQCE